MRIFSIIILTLTIFSTNVFSQTIEELYEQRNFSELIKNANSTTLTKEECFYIGYAYFQLEDDTNALKMEQLHH
jgi:hypothetical protein